MEIECVRIPKGSFTMGAPDGEQAAFDREKPQHRVEITRDFYLGKFEVTQGQYKAVTGEGPSKFKGDRLPVEQVSWEDAVKFCEKVSLRTKQKIELPTEAQWEYACRAGTTTPFHFGSNLNGELANCNGNAPYGTESRGPAKEKTVEVGSYPANPWGLHDMSGNVFEWCNDWYGANYSITDLRDPVGASSGPYRVRKGGCWNCTALGCRSAYRGGYLPGDRIDHLGFRVALVPSGQ
jgi:formylglycine-generating enzyme required for sulfatase activity